MKDSTRVPDERRLYARDQRRVFADSLNSLVDNFRNTEDTLDKDKRKIKDVPDDDDVSRVGGDESKMDGYSVAQTEMKKLARSGEVSAISGDAIYESKIL